MIFAQLLEVCFFISVCGGFGMGHRMRMNEESTLTLAQVESKEASLQEHAGGNQTFPAMVHVKGPAPGAETKGCSQQRITPFSGRTRVHQLHHRSSRRPTIQRGASDGDVGARASRLHPSQVHSTWARRARTARSEFKSSLVRTKVY